VLLETKHLARSFYWTFDGNRQNILSGASLRVDDEKKEPEIIIKCLRRHWAR